VLVGTVTVVVPVVVTRLCVVVPVVRMVEVLMARKDEQNDCPPAKGMSLKACEHAFACPVSALAEAVSTANPAVKT